MILRKTRRKNKTRDTHYVIFGNDGKHSLSCKIHARPYICEFGESDDAKKKKKGKREEKYETAQIRLPFVTVVIIINLLEKERSKVSGKKWELYRVSSIPKKK